MVRVAPTGLLTWMISMVSHHASLPHGFELSWRRTLHGCGGSRRPPPTVWSALLQLQSNQGTSFRLPRSLRLLRFVGPLRTASFVVSTGSSSSPPSSGVAMMQRPLYKLMSTPTTTLRGVTQGEQVRSYSNTVQRAVLHAGGGVDMVENWKKEEGTKEADDSSVEAPDPANACADVSVIPLFHDNYAYLVRDRVTNHSALVDPADAYTVMKRVGKDTKHNLKFVLCTHKHDDHAGGNEDMRRYAPGVDVVCGGTPEAPEVPGSSIRLGDGEAVQLGSLSIQAVATPCHTTGHTSFLIRPLLQQRHTHRDDDSSFGTSTGSGNPRLSTETPAEAATSRREKDRAGEGGEELEGQEEEGAGGEGKGGQPILFTGDTLFVGGCGKFMEGGGEEMLESLTRLKREVPPETHVYCGPEYTVQNLRFAKSLEPANEVLSSKLRWAMERVQRGLPTVPSTMRQELMYNPFLRTSEPSVVAAVRARFPGFPEKEVMPETDVMAHIRYFKDNW
eukprot:GHVU01210076.1.p1 GENE.GHVU01210076.1~~GHVU01210076.1.p1  ORF type:complete len:504 (-),score=92.50 GHVU01210076.1:49-1560(-)